MAGPGTARRGQRVALPAEPPAAAGKVTAYVCGVKPLRFGNHVLTEGVEVPGAASWLRVEAWVSGRRIRPVLEGEPFVSYEEFTGMTHEDELAAAEVERIEAELAAEAAKAAAEDDTTEE
jgi:hypothetical protein